MGHNRCFLLLLFISILFCVDVEGKIYGRCEFVRRLRSLGVKQLGTWTCIANYESHFNTKVINRNGGGYGILQISHPYWCSDSDFPGGACNITCGQLLLDDISNDIECARHIYEITKKKSGNGFSAWSPYKKYCSGNNDVWIENCFLIR